MFGYVLPMQSEMRVREFKLYRACYCGLCHTLGKKYGFAARFILNYDFNFLAMLLWDSDEQVKVVSRRCPMNPFQKKQCCARSESLDKCAGYSVILAWHKLQDSIADDPLVKTIPHRLMALFLRHAYKKASRELPDFDRSVRDKLSSLAMMEAENSPSLDGTADTFATLLSAAAPDDMPEAGRRALTQLLYHVGRWIYIIDALDDLPRDTRAGRYNPIAARFEAGDGLSQDDKLRVETTLLHSAGLAAAAFELLPENAWTETTQNTLYLGLPEVTREVIRGEWKRKNKIKNKELGI